MDPARCLDIFMAKSIVQQRLWVTRGVQGLDYCWDPHGIPRHNMGLLSDGISIVMDLVTEHPHTFSSPSTLVSGWIDRG